MVVTLANNQAMGTNLISYPKSSIRKSILGFNQPLADLSNESKAVLLRFHTVFPFDFFPDEVIIDENKISIISRSFFFTYHVHSILVSDITDISVDVGLFFASLNIIDSSNYRFPLKFILKHLTIKDALLARKIVQGLIAAKRKDIGLSALPTQQVKEEVSIVGETQGHDIRGM